MPGVFEGEVNEKNCQIHKFMTDAGTRPEVEKKEHLEQKVLDNVFE